MAKTFYEVHVGESILIRTADKDEVDELKKKLKEEKLKFEIKKKKLFEEVPQTERKVIK